jgi:hypothetical protein
MKNRKQRVATATLYVVFVVGLLLGTRCEPRIHLTTPEKDAQHLAHLAETVHTEADLRKVERMASQYEIAYRHSYGGAKALYFKSLYEPILDAAGERRAAFRAEEDHLMAEETMLRNTIADLDEAWNMPLGSLEEELAKIAANDATIAKYDAELQSLVAKKEQLAMDIIDAGYPQDMLDQIGVVEKEIMATEGKIAEVEHTNEIIILANRLQLQRTLDIEPEEVVEDGIAE